MRPLGLRSQLTLAATAVALVTIGAVTVGFNVVLRSNLDDDADNVLRARADAARDTVSVSASGRLRLNEAPDRAAAEVPVWIFDGRRVVERPAAPDSQQRVAESLAGSGQAFAENPPTDSRLYATPVAHSGKPVGTVVTGISLTPYERSETRALVFSLIFAVLVLALFLVAMRWATGRALRPVAKMTSEALTWSERDLDHRFNAGEPHDEITRLAAAFDRMLDRLAASLLHEQRLTAEVSHELRTPLAAILAESQLALRRPRSDAEYRSALSTISERAEQLQRTAEILLLASRAESQPQQGIAEADSIAARTLEAHREAASAHGVALSAAPSHRLRVGADGDMVERVISPVIENACRHARSRVSIEFESDSHSVTFLVADDGPGVAADDVPHLFEPGYRGSANTSNGAGLGLSLALRLARALGGEVAYRTRPTDGARFAVRLPRA